jgi:hypothetical protein
MIRAMLSSTRNLERLAGSAKRGFEPNRIDKARDPWIKNERRDWTAPVACCIT